MKQIKLVVVTAKKISGVIMITDTKLFTGEYSATTEAARLYSWEQAKKIQPEIGEWDLFRCPFGNWTIESQIV
jgi:hypothetical protein